VVRTVPRGFEAARPFFGFLSGVADGRFAFVTMARPAVARLAKEP
jgi:hypothetical protein